MYDLEGALCQDLLLAGQVVMSLGMRDYRVNTMLLRPRDRDRSLIEIQGAEDDRNPINISGETPSDRRQPRFPVCRHAATDTTQNIIDEIKFGP